MYGNMDCYIYILYIYILYIYIITQDNVYCYFCVIVYLEYFDSICVRLDNLILPIGCLGWKYIWSSWISWYIDCSINGLSTENRFRLQWTPTPGKMKVNNCKLIDLVIRIEFTRAILMPQFSNFRRNSIIHFRMFLCLHGNMSHDSNSFFAMPGTSCIKDSCSNLSLSH